MAIETHPTIVPVQEGHTRRSPLFLDGLLEFNHQKWGLKPLRVRHEPDGPGGPAIEAVLYLDRKGRVSKPPISPYLPVVFEPTPTTSQARLDRQWLSVASLLADDMHARGVSMSVALPPEVSDIRPWQWSGFSVEVRYTFHTSLPYDEQAMDPAVRRQIAKSERNGLRCERVSDISEAYRCIAETEDRQGFHYNLSADDLTMAQALIGEDAFRAYVCYGSNGEPACVWIVLHQPGGQSMDWMNGTATEHLTTGATKLLLRHVLRDLHADGATGFDFVGANLPSVAAAKATWGVSLVPFYMVDGGRIGSLKWNLGQFRDFRRGK